MGKFSLTAVLLSAAISVLIYFFSKDFFFFWDTVQLGSKHAHWYFENGFASFFLPQHIDSGHPPLFGMYLAIVWKVLGPSLWSSHLAMVPFVFSIVYFTLVWTNLKVDKNAIVWGIIILLSCTPLVGHIVLVSPDIVLMASFIGALYFIEANKRLSLVISILILSLISQRGFVLAGALSIWIFFSSNRKLTWYFIPGILAFVLFFVAHYLHTGWNMFHDESPWSASFAYSDLTNFLKNIVIYAWRLFDFGMISICLGLVYLLVKKVVSFKTNYIKLLGILIFTFGVITIPFTGLMNHRYYLPIYFLLSFITFTFIQGMKLKYKSIVIGAMIIGSMSGHFWIYPHHISQGWDTTLIHLPFYKQTRESLRYIKTSEVQVSQVGTAFPLHSDLNFIDFTSQGGFHTFDLESDKFILWSNVMNDFKDKELIVLQEEFTPIFEQRNRGVEMKLYKRK